METNFWTREIPRSGWKVEDGEKKKREERLNDGNNNGQATHGLRKHAWRTQAAWANFIGSGTYFISSSSNVVLGSLQKPNYDDLIWMGQCKLVADFEINHIDCMVYLEQNFIFIIGSSQFGWIKQ